MANVIAITVDEKGDLHLDLSGYIGGQCQFEEAELRGILAEFGLKADVMGLKPKVQNTKQSARHQVKQSRSVNSKS